MVVEQLPELIFTIQQITIPNVSADTVLLNNRFNPGKTQLPGEGVDFAELSVTFILDKHFKNYSSVLKWIKANGLPEKEGEGADWTHHGNSALQDGFAYSNITVVGTDAANTPVAHWNFVNSFPISLDGPNYDATVPDVEYLQANASFYYHYFTFSTYVDGVADEEI